MGGRANFRLARAMPKAREGLGKSQPEGARFPAPRLHQAHVEKTMQSHINSSDRLLGFKPFRTRVQGEREPSPRWFARSTLCALGDGRRVQGQEPISSLNSV